MKKGTPALLLVPHNCSDGVSLVRSSNRECSHFSGNWRKSLSTLLKEKKEELKQWWLLTFSNRKFQVTPKAVAWSSVSLLNVAIWRLIISIITLTTKSSVLSSASFLTVDNLFSPQWHLNCSRMTTARFPAKMKLVHARRLLCTVKPR